jgi:aspartyl-tRNA synthetase
MVKAFEIAGYGGRTWSALRRHVPRLPVRCPATWRLAAGVDRIVMLLCGTTNLRDLAVSDEPAPRPADGRASEVTPKQLRELHIRLNLPQN